MQQRSGQTALPQTKLYHAAVVIFPALLLALLLVGSWGLQVQATNATVTETTVNNRLLDEGGDPGDRNHGGGDWEVEGEILRKPSASDGSGAWLLRSDRGVHYWFYADDKTDFEPVIPALGDQVKVHGAWQWYMNQPWFVVSKVEVKNHSEQRDEKVEGILLSAPADGIGTWVIQTGLTQTITLEVDSNTRVDDGAEQRVGSWLEVRGEWQADDTFAATRIRNDTHEVNEVVVRLAAGVISTTVATKYELEPTRTLLVSANIHLFTTKEDDEENIAEKLAEDQDLVIWAELNFTNGIPERHGYKTWRWGGEDPDGYINQNAFHQVNLDPVLTSLQGEGMVIAVLDTGIALNHTAFAGRLLAGYDMVDDDAIPNDDGDGLGWGHGTHIAGIIAQTSPQSKLLPVRVLDTNGRGNTFTLAYAIEWAVAHGADVINLSLGAEADSQVLRDAVANAIAQGVIVVAAAGNIQTDVPQYPASYPGVLSVTAVDGENIKADFAAYGRGWVDLAAPGVGITSTIVGPQGMGYASWSGTSMATGFVSGAAALMRQQRPTVSVNVIEAQFVDNTMNVDAQNPDYMGKIGGLLDVAAALELMPTAATPTPTSTPTSTPTMTPVPLPTATVVATPTPATTGLPGEGEPQSKLYLPLVMR